MKNKTKSKNKERIYESHLEKYVFEYEELGVYSGGRICMVDEPKNTV